MPDASVKMGVTGLQQFKQGMNQAQQSVKTLDAQLKLNEKQLQATGDKEAYMQQKSKLLQQQITQQNAVIKQGQQALAAMEKNGVNPASQAYQKMQQQVLNAQAALLDMQSDLDGVGSSAQETSQKTDKLAESLNGINKKVSFDAVLNGIGKITDGMEAAARKVASLATDVWNTMGAAAAWADNENTLAAMYGIDVETLQRMQGASRTIDTTVDSIIKSQQKLKNNMVNGSEDVMAAFDKLGVSIGTVDGKSGILGRITDFVNQFNGQESIRGYRNATDVFWELGEALQNYGDEVERDVMAQKLFGTSWQALRPLFQAGRKEYEATMDAQTIVTQENVDKLNALDDALQGLDQEFQTLKSTVLSDLAPAFTELANGFSGLLSNFNEYLKTDEGKEKLEALSTAVTELFDGLTDVDFSKAMETANGVLKTINGALGWIMDNQGEVVEAIKAIGAAFLALKAAEVVGSLAQGAVALKNLLGNGGGSNAGGALPGGASVPAGSAGSATVKGGAVRTIANGAKKFLSALEGPALVALPVALLADSVRQTAENNEAAREWMAEAQEYAEARTEEVEALHGDQGFETLKAVWKRLSDSISTGNAGESGAFLFDFADMYSKWAYEDFPELDAVFDNISEETADQFTAMMEKALDGENLDPYAVIDMLDSIRQQLDAAISEQGEGLQVETTPELIPDAVTHLQTSLDGEALHIPVIPDLASIDGTHANGLPFVPFDGYIAALHKGERVVPANQNKNVNFVNNNYFEDTRMYNNTDVQGLAAAIAERNRHNLQGVGG